MDKVHKPINSERRQIRRAEEHSHFEALAESEPEEKQI
jgi:hypothetical protein